ncbi:hypothetical protein FRB95_002685 [Tulasnella sp. JGI-2019a]|nr:hypothetical protein FRB95_002685 [Tulasnella sp. JGI-2019a]
MDLIFIADEDEPLSIYVQGHADADPEVAHLKFLVKKHGGAAIDSSESAHVIVIVDRACREGVELRRNHAVRPGEKMLHAVVEPAWITESIAAGEILVDEEWGGHLIRAPKIRMIDDILRGRRSLLQSARAPPSQADPSHPVAGPVIAHQNPQQPGPLSQPLTPILGREVLPSGIDREKQDVPPALPALDQMKELGLERHRDAAVVDPDVDTANQDTGVGDQAHVNQGQNTVGPSTRQLKNLGGRGETQQARSSTLKERGPSPPTPAWEPEPLTEKGKLHYPYTSAEKQWAINHANWLLEWEPEMTFRALCMRLYDKVQHHSEGSWRKHISANPEYYAQHIPRLRTVLAARLSRSKCVLEEEDEENGDDSQDLKTGRTASHRRNGATTSQKSRRTFGTYTEADKEAVARRAHHTSATCWINHETNFLNKSTYYAYTRENAKWIG